MPPGSTLDPKQAVCLVILRGKVTEEAEYEYRLDGTKKRILPNAFDVNRVGHIRSYKGYSCGKLLFIMSTDTSNQLIHQLIELPENEGCPAWLR